jgi:hypothetical protein
MSFIVKMMYGTEKQKKMDLPLIPEGNAILWALP